MSSTMLAQRLVPLRQARCVSRSISVTARVPPAQVSPTQAPSPSAPELPTLVTHPYFVPRNTRGSLPVYTDIRNSNKYLTLVRNVQGNVDTLAKDIAATLYPQGSPKATNLKIETIHSRHVVLSGGKWKHDIIRWLQAKGF